MRNDNCPDCAKLTSGACFKHTNRHSSLAEKPTTKELGALERLKDHAISDIKHHKHHHKHVHADEESVQMDFIFRFEEALFNSEANALMLAFREPFNKEAVKKFEHFLLDLGCHVEKGRDVSLRENRIFIRPKGVIENGR